jgi:preprotein translocase subunit SecG
MATVILVIHLILALSIILLVLMQRSEGGGLGIGGGGMGGLATAGQTANVLTRATAICAALFFTTSLILAILAGSHRNAGSVLDSLDNPPAAVDSSAPVSDKDLPKAEIPADADQPATGAPSAPISE